jgi:hypothetical protein
MMEVVATDGAAGKGKWKVSKLVVEHNHELRVASGEVATIVPTLGMEFDFIKDANEFYYGYDERVGFKARTRQAPIATRFRMVRRSCSGSSAGEAIARIYGVKERIRMRVRSGRNWWRRLLMQVLRARERGSPIRRGAASL